MSLQWCLEHLLSSQHPGSAVSSHVLIHLQPEEISPSHRLLVPSTERRKWVWLGICSLTGHLGTPWVTLPPDTLVQAWPLSPWWRGPSVPCSHQVSTFPLQNRWQKRHILVSLAWHQLFSSKGLRRCQCWHCIDYHAWEFPSEATDTSQGPWLPPPGRKHWMLSVDFPLVMWNSSTYLTWMRRWPLSDGKKIEYSKPNWSR